jgi:hypothetical protein
MTFKVNENKVRKAFKHINEHVFGGDLDINAIGEIDVDFLDTELGFCVPEEDMIVFGLTDEFPNKKEFMNTMCHEMIHLLQIVSDRKVNHGQFFASWCQIAEKSDFHPENG